MPKRACQSEVLERDFDEHVERCLSMVLHFNEVEQMAEVIKEVYHKREAETPQAKGTVDE